MSSQTVSLIVSLGSLLSSVLVVFISSYTSTWAKKIDVEQKKEDRNQELRKIHVSRKIEAGEAVIGRWNLIINKLDWLKRIYSLHEFDGDFDADNAERLQAEEDRIDKLVESSVYTEKNYYYFYFELELPLPDIEGVMRLHDSLRDKVVNVLSERNEIIELIAVGNPGGVHAGLKHSLDLKRTEYEKVLSEYLSANANAKNLILYGCANLKQQMAKYDIV